MKPVLEHHSPFGLFTVTNSETHSSPAELPHVLEVTQIHSNDIVHWYPQMKKEETALIKADGIMVTCSSLLKRYAANQQQPWLPSFLIKTADCLPVLLASHSGYALLHAGWRGLHKKIFSHPTIKQIKPTYAYIGPHIGQENYPVGEEFLQYFGKEETPGSPLKRIMGRLHFSEEIEAKNQLNQLFPGIKIEVSNLCTFKDKQLQSFRRGHNQQRNYNLFTPDSKNYLKNA